LPADAAFLLGYILYYQRSLCFPVYYWRRIWHKVSDCVHNSVSSNDNLFSLTSCIKMFYTSLTCVFKHVCSFTCSLGHINVAICQLLSHTYWPIEHWSFNN
jgi:hypothetical protein